MCNNMAQTVQFMPSWAGMLKAGLVYVEIGILVITPKYYTTLLREKNCLVCEHIEAQAMRRALNK